MAQPVYLEPIVTEGQGIELPSPEVVMLRNNAKSGWYYRYRRQFDWDENYETMKVLLKRFDAIKNLKK